VLKADNFINMCELSIKYGNLDISQPYKSPVPVTRIAFIFKRLEIVYKIRYPLVKPTVNQSDVCETLCTGLKWSDLFYSWYRRSVDCDLWRELTLSKISLLIRKDKMLSMPKHTKSEGTWIHQWEVPSVRRKCRNWCLNETWRIIKLQENVQSKPRDC
jgi:hypothetical protein